jgi:hypothetical protein
MANTHVVGEYWWSNDTNKYENGPFKTLEECLYNAKVKSHNVFKVYIGQTIELLDNDMLTLRMMSAFLELQEDFPNCQNVRITFKTGMRQALRELINNYVVLSSDVLICPIGELNLFGGKYVEYKTDEDVPIKTRNSADYL